MTYSTNFDLDLADDFPVADFGALHLYLADRRQGNTDVGEAWPDYSAAANGLLYRFRAADDDVARACASLEASNSPPQPGRYQQERDLFGFVFQGLSALECLLFGVYFVGAMVDSSQVSLDVDRQDVKPRFVARTLTAAFPGEEFSRVLDGLVDDTRIQRTRRDAQLPLSQRRAPGRAFHTGGSKTMGKRIGTFEPTSSMSQRC